MSVYATRPPVGSPTTRVARIRSRRSSHRLRTIGRTRPPLPPIPLSPVVPAAPELPPPPRFPAISAAPPVPASAARFPQRRPFLQRRPFPAAPPVPPLPAEPPFAPLPRFPTAPARVPAPPPIAPLAPPDPQLRRPLLDPPRQPCRRSPRFCFRRAAQSRGEKDDPPRRARAHSCLISASARPNEDTRRAGRAFARTRAPRWHEVRALVFQSDGPNVSLHGERLSSCRVSCWRSAPNASSAAGMGLHPASLQGCPSSTRRLPPWMKNT